MSRFPINVVTVREIRCFFAFFRIVASLDPLLSRMNWINSFTFYCIFRVSAQEVQYSAIEVRITLKVLVPTFGVHVILFMRATYFDRPSSLTFLPLRYLLTFKPINYETSHKAVF